MARTRYLVIFAFVAMLSGQAEAQVSDGVVKLGILNDQSGPYADHSGMGGVEAVRMAVEEFGGKVLGKPIEIVFADHQNRSDVGASIARKWIDQEKVDVIVDGINSSVALAVQHITKDKGRIFLISGAGTPQLTGESCSPTSAQWTYDTHTLALGIGKAGVKQLGKTWFFVTVDYAFGLDLEKDISSVVKAAGGEILGRVRHPINTSDFSSFLLVAQGARPDVIVVANAGGDTENAIKQAKEFGLPQSGQTLMTGAMTIIGVHAMGLQVAQGLVFVDGFNPDRDDDSRAWAQKFFARTGKMPNMIQAGNYSAVRHYLKAVESVGTDEAKAVIARMRVIPINDAFAKNGKLREDGRMVHDMYLMQVKKASQSTGTWDYLNLLANIPGEEVARPIKDGGCPYLNAEGPVSQK